MMSDNTTISIDSLLRIPEDEPGELFARSGLTAQYRALAGRWYLPATRGDDRAEDALRRVNALYRSANEKESAGACWSPAWRRLTATDGRRFEVRYRARRSFELGETLIGDHVLVALLDPAHRALFDAARRTLGSLRFANDAMRAAVAPRLPQVVAAFETVAAADAPAALVLVVRKRPDQLLLGDVLARGALDPRHTAWILSDLHDLACWLQWAGISHDAISAETVFISPPRHTVALLGGWWYATPLRAPLTALPQRSADALPADVLRERHADPRIDPTLIRLLGREMLGDVPGATAVAAPRPLTAALRVASDGDAVADYAAWGRVLTDAFGPRRFTQLDLVADDLYTTTT